MIFSSPLVTPIARPNRRARIETGRHTCRWLRCRPSPGLTAGRGLKLLRRVNIRPKLMPSPGLIAGRGLKLSADTAPERQAVPSPGLTAGRGLKRSNSANSPKYPQAIARPNRRARIETFGADRKLRATVPIARPNRRARIETLSWWLLSWWLLPSPGLTAGRGLKLIGCEGVVIDHFHRPA